MTPNHCHINCPLTLPPPPLGSPHKKNKPILKSIFGVRGNSMYN